MTSDFSRGPALAIRRQLAAMPYDLYRLRLIHHQTRRPLPGQRLWTRDELLRPAHVRFLRIRNREGFDVYIHPDDFNQNAGYAGYILSIWTVPKPGSSTACGTTAIIPAWSSTPAPVTCKPGSTSAPLLWNHRHHHRPAVSLHLRR
jgi:hypothetical protein